MIDRQEFNQLLKRYVEGTCSAEETQLVDQWYELLDDETLPEISDEETSVIENRLWEKIQAQTRSETQLQAKMIA